MDFSAVDETLAEAVRQGTTPGACYAVGTRTEVAIRSFGRQTYHHESEPIAESTLWDLASLTKVVATTSLAMTLFEAGELDLDQRVSAILPEFASGEKESITLRHLLLHNSGLPAFRHFQNEMPTAGEALAIVLREPLSYPVGSEAVYSDIGFIALAASIEQIGGRPFDELFAERIADPLGLVETRFVPGLDERQKCAPTEAVEAWRTQLRRQRGLESPEIESIERDIDGRRWIKGEVHDPTAILLGGVAGHAGLFSTITDLARFMQAMLGLVPGFARPSTVELFTTRASKGSSRALGWDTPDPGSSAGVRFGPTSFGHTGFTGTSAWCDPIRGVFAVLLTNRIHPVASNLAIKRLRPRFHDLVAIAVGE